MAKIQTYKFVNPGVAASANPANAAARSQTLAFNRLGRTVSDIAITVADIEKVAIISKKDAARRELLERRQKQRERDAAAEEAAEQSKLTKKKPRLSNAVKAGAKKSFGFITQFLKPVGDFLAAVGAFAITKEVLEWFGNEENKEKLRTFLEKAQFVFDKLFGWAKTLVQTTLDGLSDLFGDESTFKDRLIGLGKVMLGITALKYLMNPFSLISDIIFLANALSGRGGSQPDKPGKPGKPGRKPPTTRPSASRTPTTRPPSSAATRSTNARIRHVQRTHGPAARNIFENALKNGKSPASANAAVTRALNKGQIVSKPAASSLAASTAKPGQILRGGLGKSANRFGLKLFGKSGVTALKGIFGRVPIFGPIMVAVGSILAGEPLDQTLFKAFGAAIGGFLGSFIPIPVLGTLLGEMIGTYGGDLAYILFKGGGAEAVGQKLKKDIEGLLQVGKAAMDWASNGFGRFYEGLPKHKIPNWVIGIGGAEVPKPEAILNPLFTAPLALKAFFSTDPINPTPAEKLAQEKKEKEQLERQQALEDIRAAEQEAFDRKYGIVLESEGGQVPQPYFLGGIVKGIKKAVGGIGKAIGGVGKAVSGVLSNPIVGAVASFIPGAAPIVAGVQGIAGLMSGDPIGAALGAASFIPGVGGFVDKAIGFLDSPLGGVAQNIFSGNFGAALTGGLNMINPALGGIASQAMSGNFMDAALSGLGMISPKAAEFASGVLANGFNPLGMMQGLADNFGMGGIMKAIVGGDYMSALTQVGSELGVDPKILGVAKEGQKMLSGEKSFSAEYAMQQVMEFIPIPMVIEKLTPIPQAVPINSGPTIVQANPTSLGGRMQ